MGGVAPRPRLRGSRGRPGAPARGAEPRRPRSHAGDARAAPRRGRARGRGRRARLRGAPPGGALRGGERRERGEAGLTAAGATEAGVTEPAAAAEARGGLWQRLYAAAHRRRARWWAGRAVRLPVRVWSVGNLHWGGTGKT